MLLSGAVSYAGAQIPDTYGSGYQEWSLHLVETTSGLSYDYAPDGGSDKYRIDVYPGTYDVYFRLNYTGVVEGGALLQLCPGRGQGQVLHRRLSWYL